MDQGKSAQQMAYEEREQRWEVASSPSATSEEKCVPNYSEEPEDDVQARKGASEYFPSRSDLTSDNQLKTISLKGGVISVYITLTLGAARNPQIISLILTKLPTLSHDPFSDTTFHDHVASPLIKKALFIVLAVGSEYFQSIRKGTFPQPMFRQRYRVRAVLSILLPSQVNQEVPPQYPASRRIFSPLTTSQRVPYHCTSVKGFCYTLRPARESANFSFAIPVGCRAPPAISFGKNTSTHEPASIPSTSILKELANSEAQVSFIDTPLLWAVGENKQSEEVSFFHANAITPGVPNATASSHP